MNALEDLLEKRGRQLARLLELCMYGLKLKPFFYYSSLCTINRIIDLCYLFHPLSGYLSGRGSAAHAPDELYSLEACGGRQTGGSIPKDCGGLMAASIGRELGAQSVRGGLGDPGALSGVGSLSLSLAAEKAGSTGGVPRRPSMAFGKHEKQLLSTPATMSKVIEETSSSSEVRRAAGASGAAGGLAVSGQSVSNTQASGLQGSHFPLHSCASEKVCCGGCSSDYVSPLDALYDHDPAALVQVFDAAQQSLRASLVPTRQKCTPSTRLPSCPHCILVLSARILTVMAQAPAVQRRLVGMGHVRSIVEALDPNFDPVRSHTRFQKWNGLFNSGIAV